MAKINKFIVEYSQIIKNVKFDIKKTKPPKKEIKRFVRIIKSELNDPRYENMCEYSIELIVVTAFLAILSNRTNWSEIADFTWYYRDYLCEFVEFPEEGTPIDDTYRRVFSLIDTKTLSDLTSKYLVSLFNRIKKYVEKIKEKSNISLDKMLITEGKKLINIDGKAQRGTGRYYSNTSKETIKNLETLNVYDASNGISLFSIPIKDKTNEIPVAQKIILEKLNLKNSIVTMDALHAQHKTFETIIKKDGDFVICVKENQSDLFDEINVYLKKVKYEDFDKNHKYVSQDNRIFYMIKFSDLAIEKGVNKEGVQRFVGCRNVIVYKNKNTERFFITSLTDMEEISDAIIGRWDVENLLHRYLDMDFNEDENKTMDKNAFNNFSILNKLALSMLKLVKPMFDNRSMTRIKKIFSGDPIRFVFAMVEFLDENVIEDAIMTEMSKNN